MTQKSKRLTSEDWLLAGLNALTSDGPQALRAERLARVIGTTKGSFYWHFKDVPDFKLKLLAYWEQNITAVPERAPILSPAERLLALANTQTDHGPKAMFKNADLAMRAWAREDATAQETLARVDQEQIIHLTEIFSDLGLTNPDFPRAIYASILGLKTLSQGNTNQDRSALTSLLAAIVALAES